MALDPAADWVAQARQVLQEEVAPLANAADRDPEVLRGLWQTLGRHNLLALRRPRVYGGPGLPEPAFRRFQEEVARASGALAFLQTQHQSAGSMIAKSENSEIKDSCLPCMASGDVAIGIGFSQLRRPGPPIMQARESDGGYRLTGTVPWVTGLDIFDQFLIGATLPSGEAVFGLVPFTNTDRDGGSIRFGTVMELAAMQSAQTVAAELHDFPLAHADVAFIRPPGWISGNDMINITLQGAFALGCAAAGIDLVRKAFERRRAEFLTETAEMLDAELSECRAAMAKTDDPEEERLRVRAWGIELAVRCAHAGIAAHSGAANSMAHDAQRVYREALVYTVSAQTTPIMEATLRRICARGGR